MSEHSNEEIEIHIERLKRKRSEGNMSAQEWHEMKDKEEILRHRRHG